MRIPGTNLTLGQLKRMSVHWRRESRHNTIIELRANGLSLNEIAKACHVDKTTVCRVLRQDREAAAARGEVPEPKPAVAAPAPLVQTKSDNLSYSPEHPPEQSPEPVPSEPKPTLLLDDERYQIPLSTRQELEPQPEPAQEWRPHKPIDQVVPGRMVSMTFTESTDVFQLSPLDRHALGVSFGDYTAVHPHDERRPRLWLPYNRPSGGS
jgi:hypothetical protein